MGTRLKRIGPYRYHINPCGSLIHIAIPMCRQEEKVRIIADNTDVFLSLLNFYVCHNRIGALNMSSQVANRSTVDLPAIVQKNTDMRNVCRSDDARANRG